MDLDSLSDRQLLDLHCSVMEALRLRGVVRSSNSPVADHTETIFARALAAKLATNSQSGYDAVGQDGTRYQIKGRRLTARNGSTQLSAIRNLAASPFDHLAAVVCDDRLAVQYAALIPIDVVTRLSRYHARTNSSTLHFRRSVLNETGVVDITSLVQAATPQKEIHLTYPGLSYALRATGRRSRIDPIRGPNNTLTAPDPRYGFAVNCTT